MSSSLLKLSALSLFLILMSCQQAPKNETPSDDGGFDFSSYETTKLPDGITRVYQKDANGQIKEEGYVLDGKKTGVWTTYADGSIQKITSYVKGIKNGKELEFDFRRQIIEEATYVNNQLHGKTGSYKFGRPKIESYYVSGKLHGPMRKYFESGKDQGKISQYVDYVNGKINGKVKYYNAAGEVTVEYDYKNGEKVSGGMAE